MSLLCFLNIISLAEGRIDFKEVSYLVNHKIMQWFGLEAP